MIRNDEKVNNVGARRMQQSALVASFFFTRYLFDVGNEIRDAIRPKNATSDLNTSKMQRF